MFNDHSPLHYPLHSAVLLHTGMAAFQVPVTECEVYAAITAFDKELRGKVFQRQMPYDILIISS